jgi:heme/copper-type cytochrome/quinol oxidase subunit 2
VNAAGVFSKTVTLDVAPGTYGIQGSGSNAIGNAVIRCVTVQVLGVAVAATAFTGANIVFGVMLAIVLVVMGLIAFAASRRRDRPRAPQ